MASRAGNQEETIQWKESMLQRYGIALYLVQKKRKFIRFISPLFTFVKFYLFYISNTGSQDVDFYARSSEEAPLAMSQDSTISLLQCYDIYFRICTLCRLNDFTERTDSLISVVDDKHHWSKF